MLVHSVYVFLETRFYDSVQIERVVKDGIDLRGVFYWTLTDNWEWAGGFSQKFGLYRFVTSARFNHC